MDSINFIIVSSLPLHIITFTQIITVTRLQHIIYRPNLKFKNFFFFLMFSLCRTSCRFLKYFFAICEKFSSLPLRYIIMLHVHKFFFLNCYKCYLLLPALQLCCIYAPQDVLTKETNWLRLHNIKLKEDFWPFILELPI